MRRALIAVRKTCGLLWIYYSSLILLFGAEFTKAYAESRGSRKDLV